MDFKMPSLLREVPSITTSDTGPPMDPYVQKPILRSADMTHAEDCAVKVYQAPFCTCGALNRWLSGSSRGLTNNQCDASSSRTPT